MKIIYHPSIFNHNRDEIIGDGVYRIRGVEKVGTPLDIQFDVVPLIEKTHSKRHLQKVRGMCKSHMPLEEVKTDGDTYTAAVNSVALAVIASQEEDFAITRPAGHHASKETAKGFCFFNNMAVAVNYLIGKGKRVVVVDIDGHRGDGTQSIFHKENRVLVCSIHQQNTYPFGGNITDIGSGRGRGYNINIPIPSNSADDVLIRCLNFIGKYVVSFKPDIVGVSAGFDGYREDHLLNLNYSMLGFYEAGKIISGWGYPVFAVLEGGYHNRVIDCVTSFVRGVNGISPSLSDQITLSDQRVLQEVEDNLARLEGKLRNENSSI